MDLRHALNKLKKDETDKFFTRLPSMYIYLGMLFHTFCSERVVRPCGVSEHVAGGQFFSRML